MLFPVYFLVVINGKIPKTKRAELFVFKGSKEAGSWGDNPPGFEVNESRRWSGWRKMNS